MPPRKLKRLQRLSGNAEAHLLKPSPRLSEETLETTCPRAGEQIVYDFRLVAGPMPDNGSLFEAVAFIRRLEADSRAL
jgi:hypothetical protein